MGADKLFENTPIASKFICPNYLLKPKSLEFWWKKGNRDAEAGTQNRDHVKGKLNVLALIV